MNFVPRYYEIEHALRERIAALGPNEPFPSDAMICDEFGVSRGTARSAVQRLVQDGLVYRLRGRGTFVAERGSHRHAGKLISFSDEMRRRGRVPRSQLLDRRVRAATEREREQLHASRVVVVKRVRLADDEAIAVEESVMPASVAETVLNAELEEGSLHAALRSAGFRPSAGSGTVFAESATDADAKLLQVRRGSPLLVERRLVRDESDQPIEATSSRYPAGRYAIAVEFIVIEPRNSSAAQ